MSNRKPWIANRNGDPRQLLHEAFILDILAQDHRREANCLRAAAAREDADAASLEEAARDYRKWAEAAPERK